MINNSDGEKLTSIMRIIEERNKFNDLNEHSYLVNACSNFEYGTAGFRMNSALMKPVCFRVGLLAGLLSIQRGKAVGVMITASHNPEEDNGVKIVEPNGEMLESKWESYATLVANALSKDLVSALEGVMSNISGDISLNGFVVLGRDTRKSSFDLSVDVINGIKCVTGCIHLDYGRITTPQLHFFVTQVNNPKIGGEGQLGEKVYFDYFGKGFKDFFSASSPQKINVCIDTANGIGAVALSKMKNNQYYSLLSIEPINVGESGGVLNYLCGADYVKMNQKPPLGALEHFENSKVSFHYCSWDGDADRIVYFYFDHEKTFHLVDGDKMAALFCVYVKKLLQESGIECKLGVVQTAYANGSSTQFFKGLRIEPEFACTGVKNLHHSAKKYDIAIYFEANGHGTIVVDDSYWAFLQKSSQSQAKNKLKSFLSFANSTVGDALSDMLLTEAILSDMKLTVEEWDKFYVDLPNIQSKLVVKDKSIFKSTNADRQLDSPAPLQKFIDEQLVGKTHGRCFVRPSGTEDIVRVYSEAESLDECVELNESVSKFILESYSK